MIEIVISVVAAAALIITIWIHSGPDWPLWKRAAWFLPTAIGAAAAITIIVPLAAAFTVVRTLSVFAPALIGLAALALALMLAVATAVPTATVEKEESKCLNEF